ncbi:hypothetical protein [Candidatus Methylomicrobium oryzae]|uniref:hypothetical protein n=1 Tax=Candidatus Methylomicrobium oryzae TaxID=2802053 RepID=UPI001924F66B|nr:hypothetical protein [Methylomicrobium sp. RS1]MBL1262463.1 hypothetical protein [Methylomicrobium sp. RS1]
MKKISYPGVPEAVVKHYHSLLAGYQYERNGVLFTEKHWSEKDEAVMLRLLLNQADVWQEITSILPESNDQIKLFDASWMAAIDYDEYRFKTKGRGVRRKNDAKKTCFGHPEAG